MAAKVFYFCFFAAIGCLVPYMNLYFSRQGLSGAQIGWLGSVAPLIALIANPFWGTVADRWQIHKWVLAGCAFIGGAVSLLFLVTSEFHWLLVLATVLSFFRTPIGSLVDSTVVDMVRKAGTHYGRQRLWGSIGFVATAFGLGQVLSDQKLESAFWLHGILLGILCAVVSLQLPISRRSEVEAMRSGLYRLTRQRHYITFLLALALLGMGTSSYANFLALHLVALGGDDRMVGLAWAVNAVAEIPIMFLGGRWFARFRYGRVLILAFGGYALVWTLMALSTSPLQVVLSTALIGFCYGSMWVAAVHYASEAAPPGLSATAQALVGAAHAGLGWSLGAVIGGYVWDAYGGQVVFAIAASAAVMAALLFWIGNWPVSGRHGR
jgi:MFS transporter, PPP family, 3-phenylpropionic acid transporter